MGNIQGSLSSISTMVHPNEQQVKKKKHNNNDKNKQEASVKKRTPSKTQTQK